MKAALLVVLGAVVLAATRPEIVTISGDQGDVSFCAWTGYAAGLLMMAYGLVRSLAQSPRGPRAGARTVH
jgi:hypothetical protein